MITNYANILSGAEVKLDQITSEAVIIKLLTQVGSVPPVPASVYEVNRSSFALSDSAPVTSNTVTKSSAVVDVKLRQICNHALSDAQYTQSNCPRCLGKGYYFDIKFDTHGKVAVISQEDKLAQALEKILITERNHFHPEYAKNLQKWLGTLKLDEVKELIKYDIVNAVGVLKAYQDSFPGTYSPRTMIATLDAIDVTEPTPDAIQYTIDITTVSGQQLTLTGAVVFADLYGENDTAENYS